MKEGGGGVDAGFFYIYKSMKVFTEISFGLLMLDMVSVMLYRVDGSCVEFGCSIDVVGEHIDEGGRSESKGLSWRGLESQW